MASNLTVESPNIEKITKEAGQWTAEAINTLWAALNETRKDERVDFRRASEELQPKIKVVDAAASVNNLDLEGASILQFVGSTNQNFTGMKAPETGKTKLVFVLNTGTGTITAKHNVTSETQNQLTNSSGADKSLATAAGVIYLYVSSKWRQIV